MFTENDFEKIIRLLDTSSSILFITGAGISADSGLPTYRGVNGLYNDTITEDGLSIEEAISGRVMDTRPDISWKHIYAIEKNCRTATHNVAHTIIAEIEKRYKRVWVLTQNIDGFHTNAGSKKVIDIHGDIHMLRCTSCAYHTIVENYAHLDIPPHCPKCSAILRPDVVLFGEMLPPKKVQLLEEELTKRFDLIFTVGTTSVFPYIAGPVYDAYHKGIPTIEVNPDKTAVSHLVTLKIVMGAADFFSSLWAQIKNRKPS